MKKLVLSLLIGLFFQITSNAQVKIGGEIGIIHNASILELESTTKAFTLTRVNTTQMNAIQPLHGALYTIQMNLVFFTIIVLLGFLFAIIHQEIIFHL